VAQQWRHAVLEAGVRQLFNVVVVNNGAGTRRGAAKDAGAARREHVHSCWGHAVLPEVRQDECSTIARSGVKHGASKRYMQTLAAASTPLRLRLCWLHFLRGTCNVVEPSLHTRIECMLNILV